MADCVRSWYGANVVTDEGVPHDEFVLPLFNSDPEQQPEFRVTEETVRMVSSVMDEYELILVRLLQEWRRKKVTFMQELEGGATPLVPAANE